VVPGAQEYDLMWSVEVFDRQGNRVQTTQLALKPAWVAATAVGGPERAEIRVEGLPDALWQIVEWMQYGVQIRNGGGTLIWWGFVERATVGMATVQLGRTLEGMANKVQAAYTYEGTDGSQTRGTTAWVQDGGSVGRYGRFEERLSLADMEQAAAVAARDTELARRSQPQPVTELGSDEGGLLSCAGWWLTLGREFYADDRGVEEHKVGANVEHVIAWQLTGQTNIGFNAQRIDDLGARLGLVKAQNSLRVVGSTSNDGVYLVESGPDAGTSALSYTSDGISFDRFDDINDSDNGLGFCKLGYMIFTAGSGQTENSGSFWVTKESVSKLEVAPATIVDEYAIPPVTIYQGHGLTVDEGLTQEKAGASVSLYHGSNKVAQGFRLASATGWTVREVRLQAAKVGTPAGNLRMRLYSASGGNPNAVLATASLAPAAVGTEMAWLSFDLGAGYALSAGTDYFVSLDLDGSASAGAFYVAGLESGMEYARGSLKVQDSYSGAWGARTPDAQMPFQLLGRTATTVQLGEMLDAAQWVTAVRVRTASGVETGIFRDGEQRLLSEVERLLEMGTSTGGRLVAYLQADRSAVVEGEAVEAPTLVLGVDGRVRTLAGQLMEEGVLPVGQWVAVEGAPAGLEALGRFYVQRAEYETEGGRLRLEPRGNA
jgi:hypothetical protein